jgi:hypothetical protein
MRQDCWQLGPEAAPGQRGDRGRQGARQPACSLLQPPGRASSNGALGWRWLRVLQAGPIACPPPARQPTCVMLCPALIHGLQSTTTSPLSLRTAWLLGACCGRDGKRWRHRPGQQPTARLQPPAADGFPFAWFRHIPRASLLHSSTARCRRWLRAGSAPVRLAAGRQLAGPTLQRYSRYGPTGVPMGLRRSISACRSRSSSSRRNTSSLRKEGEGGRCVGGAICLRRLLGKAPAVVTSPGCQLNRSCCVAASELRWLRRQVCRVANAANVRAKRVPTAAQAQAVRHPPGQPLLRLGLVAVV